MSYMMFFQSIRGRVGQGFIALILALLVLAAYADEKTLRQKIQAKLGAGAEITGLAKTPYGSKDGALYEVYVNGRMHYTDENFTFMLLGNLIDTKSNENYTEQRLRHYEAVDLALMPPLKNAMKTQAGQGKKTMYVFSDPFCRHCQELEKTLQAFPDVTTYTYLVPNDKVNPGATRMAQAIWCSANPRKAYHDYMLAGIIPNVPQNAQACETPFRNNNLAAGQLGIDGTPGIVFGDGYRISGAPNAKQLKALLAQTPR